jgi:uncharacterized protein YebE (UPF0316 family)
MDFLANFDIFGFVVLPLLVFCARIFDQSLGIIRIIFATKGLKLPAFIFGFFESFVWLLAIRQIMGHMDNIFYYIFFAAGFASGNVFGIFIEKKLSIGFVMVRVVFQKDSAESIRILNEKGYRTTVVDAIGMVRPVKMIFSTIRRNQIKDFVTTLTSNNPTAFYTVEDVKEVKEGYLPRKRKIFSYK